MIGALYRIRTHVLHEAPYQVCLPSPVESPFHIYLKSLRDDAYQLVLKSEQEGPYDIPGGAPMQGIYTIEADLVLEYRIHIGDQVMSNCFFGTKIIKKLDQMATAVTTVVSSWAPAAVQALLVQGQDIRILYNDVVRFSGEIRKITKSDTSGVWTLSCEGGACLLSDRSTEEIISYESTTSDTILKAILPSASWEGTIDTGPEIDYKTEYIDILSHVVNLAEITGYEWQVRQEEELFQVSAITETTITVDGSTWDTDHYAGWYILVVSGAGKWASAQVLSNTSTVLTLAAGTTLVTDGVAVGNAFRAFGDFKLDVMEHIGETEPVVTLRINWGLFYSERTQDINRVRNRIVVTGTSSLTQDRNSVISGCTLTMTTLETDETILSQNIDSSQDTLYVVSTAGYPGSGTVVIDDEKIAYTSVSARYFLGCTRGYDGTTPVGHNIRNEVVLVSELKATSTADFPDSGSIWIGVEKITYTSKSATSFKGLTRGVDDTEVYAHLSGILIRDAAYDDDSPETGSSVDLNGVREKIVPALGVTDQNTLDRLAQKQLLVLQDLQEWGTGTLAATSFKTDIDIGDMIAITESDGSATTNYRLVGMTWDQNTGLISIEYGDIEEYFLDDLSRLEAGIDIANTRGAVASLGTVTQVSDNGEMALVQLDTGESVWCRVK